MDALEGYLAQRDGLVCPRERDACAIEDFCNDAVVRWLDHSVARSSTAIASVGSTNRVHAIGHTG